MSHPKLLLGCTGPILFGRDLPPHLGRAFGRHVFKLLNDRPSRGLWLRDLPLSLDSLRRSYGFAEPMEAYDAEARRTGRPTYLGETRPVPTGR